MANTAPGELKKNRENHLLQHSDTILLLSYLVAGVLPSKNPDWVSVFINNSWYFKTMHLLFLHLILPFCSTQSFQC